MGIYSIADVLVKMTPYGRTETQAEKYRIDDTTEYHIEIEVTDAQLEKAAKIYPDTDREELYYLLSGSDFYRKLVDFDGILLHSSAVSIDGNGYLFSGQSGVGKSTHTSYLKELLCERCFVINDDKPAIRLIDDGVFAYGTPWSGKHDISVNTRVPVKGICFIGRGETNKIYKLPKNLAAFNIISQCSVILSEKQCDKMIKIVESLVEQVPVYKLECIADISAAELSYQTMSGEKL